MKKEMKVRKRFKQILIWCLVSLLAAAITLAEEDAETLPAVENETQGIQVAKAEQEPEVTSEKPEKKKEKDVEKVAEEIEPQEVKERQSFSFQKDASVRDALRFLSLKYQKNIVPSPNVDGNLAFTSLFDVTFEEAMDAILGPNFRYEKKGSLINVYTTEEYKKIKSDKERMVYRVFTLYYIGAEEAVKLLEPVLSGAGSVQYSTKVDAEIDIGDGGVSEITGGDSMALNDQIVIFDFPENVKEAEKLIERIDVRPAQVLIEATILAVTLTEDMDLGVDWNLLNGDAVTDFPSNIGGSGTPMETFGFAPSLSSDTGGLRIGISSGDLQGFISAIETTSDVTVLANPKILALNKQTGTVFIGSKDGYRDASTIGASGTETVGSVSFLETGTKLSFRPYIGNDGYIRMDIYPKDSDGKLIEFGDDKLPQEKTTELVTNIMVKDGQTIVLGGLFRDSVTTSRSQVPLLGDLPLIGPLFRGTSDTLKKQEVIIMLTPHIIQEPVETKGNEKLEDAERKIQGATDEFQPIGRSRIAEDNYAEASALYLEERYEEALEEIERALTVRPAYLKALKLKDKILCEINPELYKNQERNIKEKAETKKLKCD